MGKVISIGSSAALAATRTSDRTGGRTSGPAGERKHITPEEFSKVLAALDHKSRTYARDYAMFLLAYQHGMRLSEVVSQSWSDVNLDSREPTIYIRRLKGSISGEHPISPREKKALNAWKRIQGPKAQCVFTTWRNEQMTGRAIQEQFRKTALRAGVPPRLCHFHALRHGAGYALINGLGECTSALPLKLLATWLGHANVSNTDKFYSALASDTFRKLNLWR